MRLLACLLAPKAVMDFLAGVGQGDLALMGQIHVVRTVLVARPDDSDLVPWFQSVLGPAVVPVQRVGTAEFRVPSLHGAALILGFENNRRMRVDELEFQDSPLNSEWVLFIVAPCKAVVREHR